MEDEKIIETFRTITKTYSTEELDKELRRPIMFVIIYFGLLFTLSLLEWIYRGTPPILALVIGITFLFMIIVLPIVMPKPFIFVEKMDNVKITTLHLLLCNGDKILKKIPLTSIKGFSNEIIKTKDQQMYVALVNSNDKTYLIRFEMDIGPKFKEALENGISDALSYQVKNIKNIKKW
ncbi:MAG: hypothetical protein QXR30_01105 [Candidatus Woesearchaeota archaeon]